MKILLFAVAILCCFLIPALAQQEEITFTTYYPSPYGSYNELHASQLAVGAAFQNAPAANIPQNGILVEGTIALGSGVCNKEGLIQYSMARHRVEYCDGAGNWKPAGGAPNVTNFYGPGNLGHHDICALSEFHIDQDAWTNCWLKAVVSRNSNGSWELSETDECGPSASRDSFDVKAICVDW